MSTVDFIRGSQRGGGQLRPACMKMPLWMKKLRMVLPSFSCSRALPPEATVRRD